MPAGPSARVVLVVTVSAKGRAAGWKSTPGCSGLGFDRSGMTIGIHTWDHHPVTGYTTADWRAQLTGAKATLERIVGHPVPWFAYPYGSWNAAALPHLADGGVVMAFQLAGRSSSSAPLLWRRPVVTA